MASPNDEKVASVTATEIPSIPSKASSENGGFFPWLEDQEHQNLSSKAIRRFPVLGAIGLVGSLLTCLLSWMTLYFFNGHTVIGSGYFPKPAAWLSIILSLNSILAHMAVSQGVAVSWWYRASREQATVAELHNVWATGSSMGAALTSWKAFNYIALATVFVGTLPVNGILLQSAVTSTGTYKNITGKATNFSIVSTLPAGFSADLNSDGSVGAYNYTWQYAIPDVIANFQGVYKTYDSKNTCEGDCEAVVEGVGFVETCAESTIPYNLPSDTDTNATVDSTMFAIDVTWNASAPTTINFNTLFKPSPECSGDYIVKNCSLRMAKVKYPVRVQFNATNEGDWAWYLSSTMLTPSHRASLFQPAEFVSDYPATPESKTTVFGGIAAALGSYYNSSIILHPTTNGASVKIDGLFAQQLPTATPGYTEDGTPIPLPNKCNSSYTQFGTLYNPADHMLDSIQSTLLFASIFQAQYDDNAVQTVSKADTWVSVNEYHILWKYWGASVGVTCSILLFILPTFYGFWTLARTTTLSPLETARAFHAPILKEAPRTLDTPALLKEYGKKNLHTDLVHGAGASHAK